MNPHLILYGTIGCHLCELAEAYIIPIAQARKLNLSLVDIAEHKNLDLYEKRIPVLKYNQHELDWPFDTISAEHFINEQKN